MISFLDGPAAGETLALRRGPLFLRVVLAPRGKDRWDALDQLNDAPNAGEKLYAYRRQGKAASMHLRCTGRGGKAASGYYAVAEYRFVEPQPDNATMRDTEKWRTWATEKQRETP